MEQITISGHAFNVPLRFAEGHTVTAAEADALNQFFHEAVRNRVSGQIKKEHPNGLPESHREAWQAKVDDIAKNYKFGERQGRGPAVDPETRLALEEASAAIVEAVKAQGKTPPKGKELSDYAKQVLAGPQGDRFRTIAKRRLRQTREVASSVLEGTELLQAAE